MKKLFFSVLASFAVLTASADGWGNYTVSSFLNPSISFLVVSNNLGATNLTYIGQVLYQGRYQIGTNTAGTSLTAPIATNYFPQAAYYSNSIPVTWFGQNFPGSLVVITNAAIASTISTNDVLYYVGNTNNAINYFADVPLAQNFFDTMGEYGIGAAGLTNSVAYLEIVTMPWSLYGNGGVGAGSNAVTFTFEPVSAAPQNYANQPIAGWTPGQSVTFADYLWTVAITNQISTAAAPTVFRTPVPRWKFPGAKAMRLRTITTADSTNAVGIASITLTTWVP